ncbi:MAG: 50S ribosomal protein L15 [Coprobacillus sp.]|nr:50S ribosomal protein L15 [Coprobacillus sp.]
MKLNDLHSTPGSRKEDSRLGRGIGSGTGKTAGKGTKGQNARSGGGTRLGFEGGQMPIYRQLPKRGFHNVNHIEYAVVNLSDLNRFKDGETVTPELLIELGIVKKYSNHIKILGNGTLEKKLTVKANKFSSSAKEAIEKNGGTVEVI